MTKKNDTLLKSTIVIRRENKSNRIKLQPEKGGEEREKRKIEGDQLTKEKKRKKVKINVVTKVRERGIEMVMRCRRPGSE